MTTDQKPPADKPAGQPSSYRQSALAKYQSPERLDGAANVADAKGWIGVAVGFAVVGLALAWGIWGGIPNQVIMSAEMIRDGAFASISADASGTVSAVVVSPGDTVAVGDPIVVLAEGGDEKEVRVQVSGTVQGIMVALGDDVALGDSIATVVDESSQGTLSAVTYVDASEAVELRSQPATLVAPVTVDVAEYGRLIGIVSFVADIPASPAEMSATLQSQALAESLSESAGGVPYLVRITFEDPPQWTNDQEPPFQITDGTPAEAIATVGVTRPIDLLFGG